MLFSAVTSNYVWEFTDPQTLVTKSVLLADLSSKPNNYQSFSLVISGTGEESLNSGIVDLPKAEYQYVVYNASGSTTATKFGSVLHSGVAIVHGEATSTPSYSSNTEDQIVAYS